MEVSVLKGVKLVESSEYLEIDIFVLFQITHKINCLSFIVLI
jgi:hypothetical protein